MRGDKDEPCKVDGCDALVGLGGVRGMCRTHYDRVLKYGDPAYEAMRNRKRIPVADRFWAKVDRMNGPDACWEWTAHRDKWGYGKFAPEAGAHSYSHRLAWELTNGEAIPEGMYACHRCDNPPCCNPAHIFIGTPTDNNRDKSSKGRCWGQRMTHCKHGHELTPDNIVFIEHGKRRRCRQCNQNALIRQAERRRAETKARRQEEKR